MSDAPDYPRDKNQQRGKQPFGKLLACLTDRGSGTNEPEGLETRAELERLDSRLKTLISSPKIIAEIEKGIPRGACRTEKCYLDENEDLLLAYVAETDLITKNPAFYERLVKHLNDCYRCFGVYSIIMRDYCHQLDGGGQGK